MSVNFTVNPYLFNVLKRRLAGFILRVLRALRAILDASRARVFFNTMRFFMSMGAVHWAAMATTRPFLRPLVHLTPRTNLLPTLRHTSLASVIESV